MRRIGDHRVRIDASQNLPKVHSHVRGVESVSVAAETGVAAVRGAKLRAIDSCSAPVGQACAQSSYSPT